MRCNPNRNLIKKKDIEAVIDEMVKEKLDDIFEDACRQMLPQYLAICLFELKTEFGFGKKRLLQFKDGVDAYMEISRGDGFLGKDFDGYEIMDMLKEEYGIDLKNIDITIKTRKEITENVD